MVLISLLHSLRSICFPKFFIIQVSRAGVEWSAGFVGGNRAKIGI